MAVAFRASTATTYASRANTTLTAPSGLTDADILVIVFSIAGSPPPTPTPPSGFAVVSGYPKTASSGGLDVATYVWWKRAASESGNYTVTHSTASSAGVIAAYSGAGAAGLTLAPTGQGSTGLTSTAPGITTVSNDA